MNRIFIPTGIFMILLILVSCSSRGKGGKVVNAVQDSVIVEPVKPPRLNLPDLIGNTREVLLSQLTTGITYIPLETTNEFLIGEKSVHVKPCGEFLFVSEHGKPVGVFDRTGKFIRKIGAIGKGPGEYMFDFYFWPEESSRQVYVGNSQNIMVFSFEGKFLKDIVPEIIPGTFAPLGNGQLISWTFMQKEQDGKFYRLVFHDETGKTTGRVYEPGIKYDFSRGIAIMTPLLTPALDGYIYNTWENDTISKIKADGNFEPAITWVSGKLKFPQDILKDHQRFQREKDNYILDFNAVESQTAWYIRYGYKNRDEMALYDKRSGDFFVVANPDTAQRGIYNDIDGGPSFFPGWDNAKGHSFVRLINAIDLIGNQKDKSTTHPEPKDPEAAAKYREMVGRLNENSNPVVMIVEL